MEKYNLIFVETPSSGDKLLGREIKDFTLSAFKDLRAEKTVVKEDEFLKDVDGFMRDRCINVVLSLAMPLIKADTVLHYASLMKYKKISEVRLGKRNALSEIRFGKAENSGIFINGDDFLEIVDAKSQNVVYNLLKDSIIDKNLKNGVYIPDGNTVTIDDTAKIEKGAVIMPFSVIEGESVIEGGARIFASFVKDSEVNSGASVEYSYVTHSHIGKDTSVGPFARLRGADIGEGCRIGDFVEIKASTLKGGVKAAHLTYIGDGNVGKNTNIGCGTVFCNYDGKEKHKTDVGANCFIGANCNLIAPVSVGDGAFVAAGTTVTEDVGKDTFTLGRSRQSTKPKKTDSKKE